MTVGCTQMSDLYVYCLIGYYIKLVPNSTGGNALCHIRIRIPPSYGACSNSFVKPWDELT